MCVFLYSCIVWIKCILVIRTYYKSNDPYLYTYSMIIPFCFVMFILLVKLYNRYTIKCFNSIIAQIHGNL